MKKIKDFFIRVYNKVKPVLSSIEPIILTALKAKIEKRLADREK